jgi:hypothetical protein
MKQQTETGAVSPEVGQSGQTVHADSSGPEWFANLPPHDNMGVDSDKGEIRDKVTGGPSRVVVSPVRFTPGEYFHKLGLDTLQVSVTGKWVDSAGGNTLLLLRQEAEYKSAFGTSEVGLLTHENKELKVFPHGGRPSYQVLLRDGDGLQVKALPSADMPAFVIRFGARWCVENSVQASAAWVDGFVRHLGFRPDRVQLSEVHIRCDVPEAFEKNDLDRMRGVGTRNGDFAAHHSGGKLSGINNLGGSKRINFCIYDKRREQQQRKDKVLWPAIWQTYGIPEESEIWRIEARWKRNALKAEGLDQLDELTEEAIQGLWYRFASDYLIIVRDSADKRTDRAEVCPRWASIQACGSLMQRTPIEAKVNASEMQLTKQAAGCLASAIARSGLGTLGDLMDDLIAKAVVKAEENAKGSYLERIGPVLDKWIGDLSERMAATAGLEMELRAAFEKAITRRALACDFSGEGNKS